MKKWIKYLIPFLLCGTAYAGTIDLTAVSTGTTISSATENSNQTIIENVINGNIDEDNISTSASPTVTNLTTTGTTDIGNGATDTVTVTGRFDSDLLPIADATSDLGSTALSWAEGHFDQLDVDDTATFAGNVTFSGTVTGAGSTLDEAYNGGSAIDVDGDAVTLTVSDTDNNVALAVVQNDTTNNPNGVNITNTGTGYGLNVNQDGNALAVAIDSEATTANVLQFIDPVTTTGSVIRAYGCDALTGGRILALESDGSDTSTRELVIIVNENSAATGTTLMNLRQDAARRVVFIDQNANSVGITMDTEATTAAAIDIDSAGGAHFRLAGDPANGTPEDGDLWFDGTNLKIRIGATTYNVDVTAE